MITGEIWKQLEPVALRTKHSRAGAPAELSDRDFLEAVLYLNRVGCPWRDLPPGFGPWYSVYMRFRRWQERGVWQRLWQELQAGRFADARELMMDSITVRAHQHASEAPKKALPVRRLGRSRGGLTTRIHTATIDENCSVALHLTPGQAMTAGSLRHSLKACLKTMSSRLPCWIKGYDADRIRERLEIEGIEAVIPSINSCARAIPYDHARYRSRNRMERFFNKIEHFRRIATRYDKLSTTFFAAVWPFRHSRHSKKFVNSS